MTEKNEAPASESSIGAATRALLDAAKDLTKSLTDETVSKATGQASVQVSDALRKAASAIEKASGRQAERSGSTRRELLTAAGEVFAEKGFHAASLVDVAGRAGYSKGAIYAHFSSKDELMLALIREDSDVGQTGVCEDSPIVVAYREGRLAEEFESAVAAEGEGFPTEMLLSIEMLAYLLRNPEHRAEYVPRFQDSLTHLARGLRSHNTDADDGAEPTPQELSNAIAFAAIVNMTGLYRGVGAQAATGEGLEGAIDGLLGNN